MDMILISRTMREYKDRFWRLIISPMMLCNSRKSLFSDTVEDDFPQITFSDPGFLLKSTPTVMGRTCRRSETIPSPGRVRYCIQHLKDTVGL